jgi:hypothetical protein
LHAEADVIAQWLARWDPGTLLGPDSPLGASGLPLSALGEVFQHLHLEELGRGLLQAAQDAGSNIWNGWRAFKQESVPGAELPPEEGALPLDGTQPGEKCGRLDPSAIPERDDWQTALAVGLLLSFCPAPSRMASASGESPTRTTPSSSRSPNRG